MRSTVTSGRYVVGIGILLGLIFMFWTNGTVVVRADDQWCHWNAVARQCDENIMNPCDTGNGKYGCREDRAGSSCTCVKVIID